MSRLKLTQGQATLHIFPSKPSLRRPTQNTQCCSQQNGGSPQGKQDLGNTPEALKAKINSWVQKQISVAMKNQAGNSNNEAKNDTKKNEMC